MLTGQEMTELTPTNIDPDTTMAVVLATFPGAQRALFRRYHIGGCSSCGFDPSETIGQVCLRNGGLNVDEVIAHITASHQQDARMLISASDLAQLLKKEEPVKLLDIRSRQEFEAAHIEGAVLLSQPVMQEMMSHWPRQQLIVIVDHQGKHSLDAAAYFIGHNFEHVRCLRGGIDAWSSEVEPALPRYRLE
jgi:rhodanese-related sulfurtransferase